VQVLNTNTQLTWKTRLKVVAGEKKKAPSDDVSEFKRTGSSAMAEGPCDTLVSIETRVPGLSCGIICMILHLAIFIQYRSATDKHRQKDGWTDTRRWHVPHLS